MKRPLARSGTFLIASLLAFTAPVFGQGQQAGDASLRFEYQFIQTGDFKSQDVLFDYWETDTQVFLLAGDCAFNEHWTLFGSLPYVRKRFVSTVEWGGDPHNPNDPYWVDFVPPDDRFWDDGAYHGSLQDFTVGVSYHVEAGPWSLQPYISYGVPAASYPFFAKAAVGKDLWTIPVGMTFQFVPYFSDWHFSGNLAYVFSEKPLNQNVDYVLAHLSAGYWFKANFTADVFLALKYGLDGLSLLDPVFINPNATNNPPLYPDDFDTEAWYNHDRVVRNRSLNLGVGADYFFNPQWKIAGTAFQSIWYDESAEINFAFTLSVTRFFGD